MNYIEYKTNDGITLKIPVEGSGQEGLEQEVNYHRFIDALASIITKYAAECDNKVA